MSRYRGTVRIRVLSKRTERGKQSKFLSIRNWNRERARPIVKERQASTFTTLASK